jgi:NADH-ubiquinone oxidoreductase chain 5
MFKSSAKAAHELPLIMAIPLGILCLGSIFLGYLSKEMFVGVGSPFFNNSLPDEIENTHYLLFSEEFVPYKYKILPVALSMLGCILLLLIQFVLENCPIRFFSVSFFKTKCPVTGKKGLLKKLYIYLVFKWNFDVIYNNYIIKNILLFGYNVTYKSLDKGIIEVFGPYGIPKFLSKNLAGSFTKNNQYGMIYGQVNFMLFTALLFVCFYYFIN